MYVPHFPLKWDLIDPEEMIQTPPSASDPFISIYRFKYHLNAQDLTFCFIVDVGIVVKLVDAVLTM